MRIRLKRSNPDARMPVRRAGSGALDLFSCFEGEQIDIEPDKCVFIRTGVRITFDEDSTFFPLEESGSFLLAKEMEGLSKEGIWCTIRCSESSKGEIILELINTGSRVVCITKQCTTVLYRGDVLYYPYCKPIATLSIGSASSWEGESVGEMFK